VPEAGFALELLQTGALKNVSAARRVRTLLQAPSSLFAANAILEQTQPAAMMSLGGYAAGPLLVMAVMRGIPVLIQHECRDRRNQERALRRQKQRQRSDGDDQDAANTARDAAARMDEQRDGHEIRRKLQIGLDARVRPALLQEHEKYAAGGEQPDQGAPCQRLVGIADDARCLDEIEHGEQYRPDGEAKQVEENQDAPGEVRRYGTACWTRSGFGALRVDDIDGGHGGGFYLIGA
jgi:hypothetical protein